MNRRERLDRMVRLGVSGGEWDPTSALQGGATAAYDPFSLESSFASAEFKTGYQRIPSPIRDVASVGGYRYEQQTGGMQTGGRVPVTAQVGQFFSQLAKNPNAIKQMQQRLLGAGLLEKGKFLPGVLDGATQGTVGFIIQTAIAADITFDEALSRILKSGKQALAGAGPTGPQFTPPPFVKADPAAVNELIDKAFQQATGRAANPKERKKLMAVFRGWERKAYGQQLKAARAQFAGRKATVTDFQPEQHVVDEASEVGGGEAAQYGLGGALEAIAGAIGGGR